MFLKYLQYFTFYIILFMKILLDYVLSKEAVRRFVSVSIPLKKYPQDNKGAENFEIGS